MKEITFSCTKFCFQWMSVDVDLVRVFISSLSLFKVSMRMVIALSMGMDGHKLLVFCLDLSIKFYLMLP